MTPVRLAIVATHPIQYYSPWFRYLQQTTDLEIRVFYLWDFGVSQRRDSKFQRTFQWDVPLLDGYAHEFVPNHSHTPGTDRILGLWNPSLAARVREFQPDAVLLLAYNHASIYRFLVQWRGETAPILFRGDSHRLARATGMRAALKRQFIRALFHRFDACLYVGLANRRYFEEHDVPPDRLFFAPHAVDNERFIAQADAARRDARQWRDELGIPSGDRVVLFAGKFEPKKRPLDLLTAFRSANVSRASLLFVGSGEQDASLRAATAGDANVFFAPFQNQSHMVRTYAAADLFVLPSYGAGESWGLAVNEAMCLATPVVVSSHVGCAEDLVSCNETGIVFPAGDMSSLAHALADALSDDDRLRRWGQAGRSRIDAYSYPHTTAGLLEALASLTLRREGTGSMTVRDIAHELE